VAGAKGRELAANLKQCRKRGKGEILIRPVKIFFAVLAAILVAYAAIHWNDGKNAQLEQALRLSRNVHTVDEQVMTEMDAKLQNTGPIRSKAQLPIAQEIRARATAHLKEVTTNPFAGTEEPAETRQFIALTDKVIAELARTAASSNQVVLTEDSTPKDPSTVPAPKQWHPAGTALDKPAK